MKTYIFLFLEKYFFKIPKNSIAEADTKKHTYVSAKPLAFADCQDEFWMLYIWKLKSEFYQATFQCIYGKIWGLLRALHDIF